MPADRSPGPIAEFCAGLRIMQQASGMDRAALARLLARDKKIGKSQLYAVLAGEVRRPPDWNAVVEPIVYACSRGDRTVLAEWRRRHDVLVRVHQELARLTRPPAVAQPGESATVTLPADLAAFIGRTPQVQALLERVDQNRDAVAVYAIDGMAGVGKTTLAVHVAHRLAARFPDCRLFVDLRAHTAGQDPADPAEVLAALLNADGVDPRRLPDGTAARAAMWRDRTARRRVLLVLDNAASSAQVAPLLPAAAGSLALVTSRRYLGDLPGDAVTLSLEVLPAAEAVAMFVRLVPRASAEPDAVTDLVEVAGYLPLAISVLARLLARHETWTVADLVADARAGLLTASAEHRTVGGALDLSYRDLAADRQRVLRLLGLHLGATFDAHAVAALTAVNPAAAAGHLDALQADRLLIETSRHRYRMHDLVREYALARAGTDPDRDAGLRRLYDYYAGAASAANAYIARQTRPAPQPPLGIAAVRRFPDRTAALGWLRAERDNIVACVGQADAGSVPALVAALMPLLELDGPWALAADLHERAREAARSTGDRLAEANAVQDLGRTRRLTGDFVGAAEAYLTAFDLYRDLGVRLGEANALNDLGRLRYLQGDLPASEDPQRRALDIYREIGERLGEANALNDLGRLEYLRSNRSAARLAQEQSLEVYREIGDRMGEANVRNDLGALLTIFGDYAEAIPEEERALEIFVDLDARLGQANTLFNLGNAQRELGDPRALGTYQRALAIYRDLGHKLGAANTLCGIATAHVRAGDYAAADQAYQEAILIYHQIGDRGDAAATLNDMGMMHLAAGDPEAGRRCHRQALQIAREIGKQSDEAHALAGLGRAARDQGDRGTAVTRMRAAMAIYQRIGAMEVAELAGELAAVETLA